MTPATFGARIPFWIQFDVAIDSADSQQIPKIGRRVAFAQHFIGSVSNLPHSARFECRVGLLGTAGPVPDSALNTAS
jgi:hypothetical protein